MTTLRSFQAEIEQISLDKQKQAIKDAREAHAIAELAKHHGKVVKKEAEADEAHDGPTESKPELPLEVGLVKGRRWAAEQG